MPTLRLPRCADRSALALAATHALAATLALAACGSPRATDAADATLDATLDATTGDSLTADAPPDAPALLPPSPRAWTSPRDWAPATPAACPPPAPVGTDVLAPLLGAHMLDRTIGIPRSFYTSRGGRIANDPSRLTFFHRLQEDFGALPCYAGNVALRADEAVASDHPLTSMIANAAADLDRRIRVGGAFPGIAADTPLLDAIRQVFADAPFDRDAVARSVASVPASLQRAAARILVGAVEAVQLRERAVAFWLRDEDREGVFDVASNSWLMGRGGALDPDGAHARMFAGSDEGLGTMLAGGARLAQAIDEAELSTVRDVPADLDVFVDTPLGAIVLRGGADHRYVPREETRLDGALLLVIDTGGSDTYEIPAGANVAASNPVSVHIDLGGNDRYGYAVVTRPDDDPRLLPADVGGRFPGNTNTGRVSLSNVPRQGSGVLGYGMLLDLGGGDDTYRSLRRSQGAANFGVGILWDDGGTDRYDGEAGVQGAALGGVAILYDGGGNDTYRAWHSAQAFGWLLSAGVLYDRSGADTYEMVIDQPVMYPSPQLPGRANSSLGQGCAFGWRRDANGRHYGGGIAMLREREGNDRYTGATFVQGSGYWMGLGILADADGDDQYQGLFYAQGATAHFALAAFLEGAGNDLYNQDRVPVHSAIGLAHDFSVTYFVDDAGNDRYRGPDRGIGASKCHGLSLFVDNAGDDRYEALHNRAIGWATDYDWAIDTCGDSDTIPTYAFFVDVGGTDEYIKPDATGYGNDTRWITVDPVDPTAREYSGGVDAVTGTANAWAYGAAWQRLMR